GQGASGRARRHPRRAEEGLRVVGAEGRRSDLRHAVLEGPVRGEAARAPRRRARGLGGREALRSRPRTAHEGMAGRRAHVRPELGRAGEGSDGVRRGAPPRSEEGVKRMLSLAIVMLLPGGPGRAQAANGGAPAAAATAPDAAELTRLLKEFLAGAA